MKNLTIFLLFFLLKTAVFSQDFDKLIEEGDVFYNDGKYEEAARIFSKAIDASPENSKGYWYRGDAYMENHSYSKAIADYTKAIAIEPGFWKFYKKRGDCYYSLEQYEPAARDFSKGIELNPTDSLLWLYRGDAYVHLKKNDLACVDYRKAFELGETTAKSQAKNIACDWAKAEETPCPQGEAAIGKVEVDPFTGAVFVSKGLSYDKFQMEPEKGSGVVTGPRIGKDDSFILKLLSPQNFCPDGDGDVFFGLGFGLYDEVGAELGKVGDLYAEKNEGLPSAFLESISATLSFAQLEIGGNYLLKVRFFDKRGNGEVLVEMPFSVAAKSDIFNNTSTTSNTLGTGIKSAGVGAELRSLAFKTENTPSTQFGLKSHAPFTISLQGIKKIDKKAQYVLRIVNSKGEIIHNETGKVLLKDGNLDVYLPAEKIAKGMYTVWVKLFDATKNTIGITIPLSAN